MRKAVVWRRRLLDKKPLCLSLISGDGGDEEERKDGGGEAKCLCVGSVEREKDIRKSGNSMFVCFI